MQSVYKAILKNDPASQRINCSCCGYDTCEEMATAIYNGFNQKENCIYYLHQLVLQEQNAVIYAAEEAHYAKDEMERKTEQIVGIIDLIHQDFPGFRTSISQVAAQNRKNADASGNIARTMEDLNRFSEDLRAAIDRIQELLTLTS